MKKYGFILGEKYVLGHKSIDQIVGFGLIKNKIYNKKFSTLNVQKKLPLII